LAAGGQPDVPASRRESFMEQETAPIVRLQLAFSLGEWTDPRAAEALARLAKTGDRWLRAAVLSSARTSFWELLKIVPRWPAPVPGRGEFTAQLCSLAVADGDFAGLDRALAVIAPEQGSDPSWFEPLA